MVKNHKHTVFNVLLVNLCLILGIVVIYIKVQNFDFVGYDDELYVTENHIVQKGVSLEGIKWAFTTFHSANWHPLTWLSHMLDYEFYRLNAGGHHWTNVEVHIANTLLLFFILFKMTGTLWRSAFVAALFALHPLHVESVAWISERKDVLSTFFGLLSVVAYYCYVKKSSVKYYILVFVLLSISLMAKPMLVTLPFILLLLDFWPLNRIQYQRDIRLNPEREYHDSFRKIFQVILEKIPLLIPVVISCIVTFIAQKSDGAVKPLEILTLKYRIANAIVSYLSYALRAVWPHKLAVFYPHSGSTLPSWQIVGCAILIVGACYWATRSAKLFPYITVGLLWYFGTLVPVIGLVQVGDQAMADRYTYIPLIGIFIIVAWGVPDLLKKKLRGQRSGVGGQRSEISSGALDLFDKRRFQKILLGISAGILLVALSWKTYIQLNSWENGITLFEHAVSVTDNNYLAQNNLGAAYEPIDLDKALSHYNAALKIDPSFEASLYNLGNVFFKQGRIDEAVNHYLKALKIKPDYQEALNNLGEAFVKKNDYDKAAYYFKEVLRINPQKTDAKNNIANVLFMQGRPDEAIHLYEQIIKTNPENPDVHYNLAFVLTSQNKIRDAVQHYYETIRIDPKYSKAYFNLGNILLNQGKLKEATTLYLEATRFNPDYAQAYDKLGVILFKQGKFRKAEIIFSKALQIDPDFSQARTNLDIVRKRLSKMKS